MALHLLDTGPKHKQGDAPVHPPSSVTRNQLQHIGEMQRGIDEEKQNEMHYVHSQYAYVRINVQDLRRVLGLPDFPLYAPYRQPVPSQPPAVNVEDTDHQEPNTQL
jgi:hypothetical protein